MPNLSHATSNQPKAVQASSPHLTKTDALFPLHNPPFSAAHLSPPEVLLSTYRAAMARSACEPLLLVFVIVVTFSLLAEKGAAKEFTVGGSMSWEVPPNDYTQLYNNWAEKNRFTIGDSLVFNYDAGKDSVLLVTKDAYDNCKTDLYLQSFKDGHTVVKLNHSGPFYFISGNADHCKKHQKLVVVVLSDRRVNSSPPLTHPSPPSPAPSGAVPVPASSPPSPTPASGRAPTSPAPSPSETSDMVPESDHKKKNGASSILLESLGGFGAFIGSFLFMMI